jgi:hypothetical protein
MWFTLVEHCVHLFTTQISPLEAIVIKKDKTKYRDFDENIRFAKSVISAEALSPTLVEQLRDLTKSFKLSMRSGDLLHLHGGWYVTHTGLIRLAARRRCRGIHVQPIPEFSDTLNRRYTFKATVYKSLTCPGFVGYSDADPSNVSYVVQGAEMRVAETRAVNRALRKAYGISICSVDEIGSVAEGPIDSPEPNLFTVQPPEHFTRRCTCER